MLLPAKPKFSVRVWEWYRPALLNVTLLSPEPTVVGRVLFNARHGEKDCGDVSHPKTMEMGDTLSIELPAACGDKIVRVEIDTDRGTVYWSPANPMTQNGAAR